MTGKDNLGRFTTGNTYSNGHTAKQRETIAAWDAVISPAAIKKLAKKLLDIALNGKGMPQIRALCYLTDRQLGRIPERIEITNDQPMNVEATRQQIIESLGPNYHDKMKAFIADKYKDIIDGHTL